MITRSIVFSAVVVAACSTTVPPPTQGLVPEAPPATATTTAICEGRTLARGFLEPATDELAQRELVAMLEQLVRSACQPRDDVAPICSALFLVAVTDPVVAVSLGFAPDLVERMVSLHVEALRGALDRALQRSADSLAAALETLIELDVGTALGSDVTLAAVVVARGKPAIVEPIRAAEDDCN